MGQLHFRLVRDVMLLLCALLIATITSARAAESAIATQIIVTTETQIETQISVATVGTSVSTTTVYCDDGSCAAITVVSIPILSTVTVDSTSVYVSTIGFTTLYSSVADPVASTTPVAAPNATPTSDATTTSVETTTSASSSQNVAPIALPTTSTLISVPQTQPNTLKTSTRTLTSSRAAASTSSIQSNTSSSNDSSHTGLSPAAKIGVVVFAIFAVLAILAAVLFAYCVWKRQNKSTTAQQEDRNDDTHKFAVKKDRNDIGGINSTGSLSTSASTVVASNPKAYELSVQQQQSYELSASITNPDELSSVPNPYELSSVPKPHDLSTVPNPYKLSSDDGPHDLSSIPQTYELSSVPNSYELSSVPGTHDLSSVPDPHKLSSDDGPHDLSSIPQTYELSSVPNL